MDGNNLGENRDPHIPGNATPRGGLWGRQRYAFRDTFRVDINGRLDLLDISLYTLPVPH